MLSVANISVVAGGPAMLRADDILMFFFFTIRQHPCDIQQGKLCQGCGEMSVRPASTLLESFCPPQTGIVNVNPRFLTVESGINLNKKCLQKEDWS